MERTGVCCQVQPWEADGRPTSKLELIQEVNEKPQELKWLPLATSPSYLWPSMSLFFIGLLISNLRNSGGQELSESLTWDGHMKDYQRPVLTLKCCPSWAVVLSRVWCLAKPQRATHWCVTEESEVTALRKSRACMHLERHGGGGEATVPAWAFYWHHRCKRKWPFVGLHLCVCPVSDTVCSLSAPPNCKKSFALCRVRPASRLWKPLGSASFPPIIRVAETRCGSWKKKTTKQQQKTNSVLLAYA